MTLEEANTFYYADFGSVLISGLYIVDSVTSNSPNSSNNPTDQLVVKGITADQYNGLLLAQHAAFMNFMAALNRDKVIDVREKFHEQFVAHRGFIFGRYANAHFQFPNIMLTFESGLSCNADDVSVVNSLSQITADGAPTSS